MFPFRLSRTEHPESAVRIAPHGTFLRFFIFTKGKWGKIKTAGQAFSIPYKSAVSMPREDAENAAIRLTCDVGRRFAAAVFFPPSPYMVFFILCVF